MLNSLSSQAGAPWPLHPSVEPPKPIGEPPCARFGSGSSSGPSPAVITLSRRQFETASLQEVVPQLTDLKLDFRNDVYCKVRPWPRRVPGPVERVS